MKYFSQMIPGRNSQGAPGAEKQLPADLARAMESSIRLSVIYEDPNILILNKPSGMLSQKAAPSDLSLNEYMIAYLLKKGDLKLAELATFRPSVCNRLDRNTSGLVTAGKALYRLQQLSEILRDRTVKILSHDRGWGDKRPSEDRRISSGKMR